jgi:hypothetical protein
MRDGNEAEEEPSHTTVVTWISDSFNRFGMSLRKAVVTPSLILLA